MKLPFRLFYPKEDKMDTIQTTEAPVNEPQNIDELMKLLAEKPEQFALTDEDAEPTEAEEAPVLN